MKKIAIKLFILCLPICLVIITTNVIIDPAHVFNNKEYIQSISSIIAKGNNVDNVSNYDERLMQLEIIKKCDSIDLIVMGSSRIMEIRSSFFKNNKVLNIGVSHANVNDLVALAGVLDSLNKIPKAILVGLDFSIVANEKASLYEWQTIGTFYNYFLNKNTNKPIIEISNENKFKKLKTILSFDYFKKSIAYYFKEGNVKYTNILQQVSKKMGRFSDGSMSYGYDYTHPNSFLVANDAKRTGLSGIPNIDLSKLDLLNDFVNYFQRKNTKITFLLVPYHINYFNSVNSSNEVNLISYENLYKDFCNKKKIKLIGSFNPEVYNIKQNDFYDMYHCSGSSIQKIFKQHNIN